MSRDFLDHGNLGDGGGGVCPQNVRVKLFCHCGAELDISDAFIFL